LELSSTQPEDLAVDSLDLVQLHCPPTEALYRPELFAAMDDIQKAGKIKAYGVSVEKVEEALKAIEFPGVVSIQIIYNIFRRRPAELFFKEAKRKTSPSSCAYRWPAAVDRQDHARHEICPGRSPQFQPPR